MRLPLRSIGFPLVVVTSQDRIFLVILVTRHIGNSSPSSIGYTLIDKLVFHDFFCYHQGKKQNAIVRNVGPSKGRKKGIVQSSIARRVHRLRQAKEQCSGSNLEFVKSSLINNWIINNCNATPFRFYVHMEANSRSFPTPIHPPSGIS